MQFVNNDFSPLALVSKVFVLGKKVILKAPRRGLTSIPADPLRSSVSFFNSLCRGLYVTVSIRSRLGKSLYSRNWK